MSKAEGIGERFQEWVESFPADAKLFVDVAMDESQSEDLRRHAVAGMSYILRQLDFVPDHYRPTGVIDDCLVLRVLAEVGSEYAGALDPGRLKHWFRLANDREAIEAFLGDYYTGLDRAVRAMLVEGFRHKTPAQWLSDKEALDRLADEVRREIDGYVPPVVDDPTRAERELLSYLKAKVGK